MTKFNILTIALSLVCLEIVAIGGSKSFSYHESKDINKSAFTGKWIKEDNIEADLLPLIPQNVK
ncbi:hypothetical protein [Candidatus Paracaedibacter symbiosus]|uniref:hypothetical protein n=1 Tax=Candidatus Paracaedibacter symbiosus TaxID=244582 RepID=UPI0005094E82|nr:hypothetical protein [Candidatus Paracaedibacter symbiosus]